MRLPTRNMGGVQNLGREDVSAPAREWAAEANANNAFTQALNAGTKMVSDIFEAQDKTKNLQTLATLVSDDTRDYSKTLSFMRGTPVIDINDESVDERIREHARKYQDLKLKPGEKPTGMVNTYDIIDSFSEELFKSKREEALKALDGTGLSDSYITKMTATTHGHVEGIVESKLKHRQGEIGSLADLNYDKSFGNGDIEEVTRQIAINVNTGAWTEQKGNEKLLEVPSRVAKQNYQKNIVNADTDADLDVIEDSIRDNTDLDFDDKNTLYAMVRGQDSQQKNDRTEKQRVNMANAYAGLGGLSTAKIKSMVKSQTVSTQQGMTLQRLLDDRNKGLGGGVGGKKVANSFKGMISNLRISKPGDSMRQKKLSIDREIRAAESGYYADNDKIYSGARLNGDQALKLLDANEKEYKKVYSNEGYSKALEQIKKITGTDGLVDITGNTNNIVAYMEGKRQLDDFADENGFDANFGEWSRQNVPSFNPALYDAPKAADVSAGKSEKDVAKLTMLKVPLPLMVVEGSGQNEILNRDGIKSWLYENRDTIPKSRFNAIARIVGFMDEEMSGEEYMKLELMLKGDK